MPGQRKRDLDDAETVLVCCVVWVVWVWQDLSGIELCGDGKKVLRGRREGANALTFFLAG